jgi:riboflavin kinase/FMN adenylyltransferase
MNHVQALDHVTLTRPSIVTIGVFDGIHRGHQHLLRQLVEQARGSGRLAVAITFHPHPDLYFGKVEGRYYLTSPGERAEYMGALGIDTVITLPFDDGLRTVRAAAFVERLRTHLMLEQLWIGADFALGYKREGTPAHLAELGTTHGFTVRVVELLAEDGAAISSTAIRRLLAGGHVEGAAALLGRPYHVGGRVVRGQARGRTIGFPTANIEVWREQVIPANGVYAGWAVIEGDPTRYMAVTNIGQRPTFAGEGVTVEAHLLDYAGDLYDRHLRFVFERRLRAEQKFSGVEALIAQIRADAEAARGVLGTQAG